MSLFKVGDRVKLVEEDLGIGEEADFLSGIYGTVQSLNPFIIKFDIDRLNIGYCYNENWFQPEIFPIYEQTMADAGPVKDNVNSPAHYNTGKIECITYLEDTLGEGITYYLEGNIKKYLHRFRYKNGLEDLKKAQWYLNKLIEIEGKKK